MPLRWWRSRTKREKEAEAQPDVLLDPIDQIARMPVSQLLVLRKAVEGRVMVSGSFYFDRGRPLPTHLRAAIPHMLSAGVVKVVTQTHDNGYTSDRVVPTQDGVLLLADLEADRERQQAERRAGLQPGKASRETGSAPSGGA